MKKWLKTTISLLLAIIMIVGNAAIARAEGGYITIEPSDESWDVPLSALAVSCGDYEPNGGASEGPANLAVERERYPEISEWENQAAIGDCRPER